MVVGGWLSGSDGLNRGDRWIEDQKILDVCLIPELLGEVSQGVGIQVADQRLGIQLPIKLLCDVVLHCPDIPREGSQLRLEIRRA